MKNPVTHNNIRSRAADVLRSLFLLGLSLAFCTSAARASMENLTDDAMSDIAAQGLFWSDKIGGSELVGASAYSTPFTFYRMGIDGELAMNANISKMALGCGGVNDALSGIAGCDMDVDYVSFMGRSGTSPGNPLSAFTMTRPYIEIAVKNDGSANREIAGIKIGTATADGAMSIGRRYTVNGAVNQENTMNWTEPSGVGTQPTRTTPTNCNTGASIGAGVVGCHSGANVLSGFLGAEMSITMHITGCIIVIFCIGLDAWGCAGRTQTGNDNCGTAKSDALFVDLGGTRMQYLGLRAAHLSLQGSGVAGLFSDGYASMNADTRTLHKLTFDNGGDFFISWQREPIAYPNYSKMAPTAYLQAIGAYATAMDACATATYNTARCNSAYAVPANTGWWMNAPSVKLLDIYNSNVAIGNLSLTDALNLFAAPGYLINNPEFNMTPAKNCYGATRFC